jgi:tetratricopeptide (TPR) repeat protein
MSDEQNPVDPHADEAHLASLGQRFAKALQLREQGEVEAARRELRAVLQAEPRLAEPRLELAHMAALEENWEEAEAQARDALKTLLGGGQWTLDLHPAELRSFALNFLGEIIVRPLEEGDLFLQDRDAFQGRWNEAASLFAEAVRQDGTNEDARRNRSRYRPLPTGGGPVGEA